MQTFLIHHARIGIGAVYFFGIFSDLKTQPVIFKMMAQKKVPLPRLFFAGAIAWKLLASLALIFNFHTFAAALLLCLFIFIANTIFNNFWSLPPKERSFPLHMFLTNLSVCFGLLAIAAAPL